MIVDRREIAQVDHRRPPAAILGRQPRHPLAHLVAIGDRPAPRIGFHAHPLGAQRIELAHRAAVIGQHLDIAIAVQQQLRRQRLDQRLAAAARGHQREQRRIAGLQGRAARAFGHQLHRPLRHRIVAIGVAHLRLVAARPFAHAAGEAARARQSRPRAFAHGLSPEPFHALLLKLAANSRDVPRAAN
ncbi:hypothetical protein HNP52_001254 [Sphingomonas kyeonggiensis]|uniref:Uncharacterized protein n=1 Tax=Sphingomonas kyeonggiensis TaxID=1268553 RepID=A0A7W7NQU9_9SPHN|nr:hypothetical protein [Sphingomonas kyeonggiensis]